MSEPFLGEVRIVGFNFAPRGWALCNGQILPIDQNQALYSILGTTYGGDGQTTFALPDLRGRAPIHEGSGHTLGQRSGEATHTLTAAEMPAHDHAASASSDEGTSPVPTDLVLARTPAQIYHDPTNLGAMNGAAVSSTGGSQPHDNMQPYIALNFIIALRGLFPSRN